MAGIRDEDGKTVKDGDTITFSYGIPPVRVEAKIAEIKGELFAMTPGHNPDRCKVKDLPKHVGEFWKIRGAK